jgi:SAM-dependent methyltransferase
MHATPPPSLCEAMIREIAGYVPPNATRVLHVGCGDGLVTQALARALPNAEVLGISTNEDCVLNARFAAPDDLLNVHFATRHLHALRRYVTTTALTYEAIIFATPPGRCRPDVHDAIRSFARGLANAADILRARGRIIIVRSTLDQCEGDRVEHTVYHTLCRLFGLAILPLPEDVDRFLMVAEHV